MKRFPLIILFILPGFLLCISLSCKNSDGEKGSSQTQTEDFNVIVISLDGARPDFIRDLISSNNLAEIKNLTENGIFADKAITLLPSLTAVAHSSIISGTFPEDTGIIANTFCKKSENDLVTVSGFAQKPESETLWEVTKKYNISTAVICWPHIGLYSSDSPNHIYVSFPDEKTTISPPFSQKISQTDMHPVEDNRKFNFQSFSKPHIVRIPFKLSNTTFTLFITFFDSLDDKKEFYNSIIVDKDDDYTNGYIIQTKVEQWFKIANLPPLQSGLYYEGWIKIISNKTNNNEYTLYCNGFFANNIQPKSVCDEISNNIGCFPGTPDYTALANKTIDENTYIEQAYLLADWIANVTLFVKNKYNPRVLITYQSAIDEIEHQFMMVDKEQYNYSEEKSKKYMEYIYDSYKHVSKNIGKILSSKNYSSKKDIIFIISDHGMCPIIKTVNLRASNIVDKLFIEKKIEIVCSGACANIYVRNKNALQETVKTLVTEFEKINTSNKDLRPFQSVFTKEELKKLKINHPNTGDIFVLCRPGFIPVSRQPAIENNAFKIFDTPNYYAQHGYDPNSEEMYALFIASGDIVKKGTLRQFSLIDLAATIADILRIPHPKKSVGKSTKKEILRQ